MKNRARLDSSIVGDLMMLKVNGHILQKHVKDIEGRDRIIPTVYTDDESQIDNEETGLGLGSCNYSGFG